MAIKFKSTKDSSGSIKSLVYGEAGAGKTVLCSTAPSPIILSAESGLLSLADHDIPVIEINSAADCTEALNFIKSSQEAAQFSTICLDSISDIAEVMLTDYKAQFTDVRQAYGKLADDMGVIIRDLRGLVDKNVYVTAKIGSISDDYSGIVKYAPSMPGKNLTNSIPFAFDELMVLRLYVDENAKKWRYLQTEGDMQFIAKDRSGKLSAKELPDLSKLYAKILAPKGEH